MDTAGPGQVWPLAGLNEGPHRRTERCTAPPKSARERDRREGNEDAMKITFIGTGACTPLPGGESACLLVNGTHLVDTGWCAALKMRSCGCKPEEVKTVFITHWHVDHYLGLPSVLLCLGLRSRREPEPLGVTIAGPAEGAEETVEWARKALREDLNPELTLKVKTVPLAAGDGFEDDEFSVETFPLPHRTTLSTPREIASLAYRFTERSSGQSFVTAWDTSHLPRLAEFARDQEVLVHDAAHTSPADAADIARRAAVERLYLIHYEGEGEAGLSEARKVFPNTFLAEEGKTVELSAP